MQSWQRNSQLGDLMSEAWTQDIQLLLSQTKVAFLSTQGALGPESSMAPFAIFEGKVLLHLSQLARHSKNIQQTPNIGLMICTPETKESSPLALPRISFTGVIEKVSPTDLVKAKSCYLDAIPDAAPLFDFTDFTLYQLCINEVFWVGGFGSARKIPLETWLELSEPIGAKL